MVLNYNPAKAEIVQIRAKFNGITIPNPSSPVTLLVQFGTTVSGEPALYKKEITIPARNITTNDDWFTYVIELDGALSGVSNITGVRLRFLNIHSPTETGTVSLDYIYIGPALEAPQDYCSSTETTYGYDSSYTADSLYSDNKSLFTEGHGVVVPNSQKVYDYDAADNYTEIKFSFLGTGFDLISRTGKQQATIRVEVFNSPEKRYEDLVKTLTVNNKGELELYQIPVVSVQGLTHGRYYVRIWINDKISLSDLPQIPGADFSALTRGNEFYLDAIRIYDPIDVSSPAPATDGAVALEAYKHHKEAYNYIKEIRNILLIKEIFDTLNATIPGAVFVDVNSGSVIPDSGAVSGGASANYTTANIETYNKIGPKNEVYLAPGQAVAFRLAVDTARPLASLDIGAKTILSGSNGMLTVGFVVSGSTVEGKESFSVRSASAQYHAIDASNIRYLTANSNKEVYVVIYNSSTGSGTENIISLTDIKVAYEAQPDTTLPQDQLTDPEINKKNAVQTEPVRFLVDSKATEAVELFVNSLFDTPITEEKPVEPDPTENIRILHSLSLASNISINYVVYKSQLEGCEDLSMLCIRPLYEGNSYLGNVATTLYPVDMGSYYSFTLSELTAVNMNDTVEAYLSLNKNGQSYTTAIDSYCIASYAYAQLSKDSASLELKTLCAELLRYGALAQEYKGYRTDCPADGNLTEAQRSYLTDPETVTFGSESRIWEDLASPAVSWVGKSLTLDSKVSVKFVFDASAYAGSVDDLSLVVTYKDYAGKTVTLPVGEPLVYNSAREQYSFTFDGLLAAELRTVLYVAIYEDETQISATMEYSPAAYGEGKSGPLLNLCKALLAYSDAAKAYFD